MLLTPETRQAMEACRESAKAVVRASSACSLVRAAAGGAGDGPEEGDVLTVGMGVMAKTLSALLVNNHKVSDARLRYVIIREKERGLGGGERR